MRATSRQAVEALIPFYLNGNLADDDRAEVERFLNEDPEGQALRAWHRKLRDQLKESELVPAESVPSFTRVKVAIAAADRATAPSLATRIAAWFDRVRMTPGFAVAALLVITLQGILLGVMHRQGDDGTSAYSEYRASQTDTEVGPFIRVSLKPDAREIDVRMLMVGLGATYVGGPSQLGDYYLYVQRDQIDRALVQIKASQYVSEAVLIEKVPPIK